MAESTNDEEIAISLGNIEVEWERQLQLQGEQVMTFDPLTVTLIDDKSAFRIGNYLKQEGNHVKKLLLQVQAENVTVGGAQGFIRCLKGSHVIELKLEKFNNSASDSTIPDVWQVVLDGVMGVVPILGLPYGLDDAYAYRIGSNLIGNTTLQNLSLGLSSTVTEHGAQRLADGIRQAHIHKLELGIYVLHSSKAIEILCGQAVLANIQELTLRSPMENTEAVTLGEALVANKSLKTLSIYIGDCLTYESAFAFAIGLRQSNVARLEMEGSTNKYLHWSIEDVIYREGIQHSQSIRSLRLGTFFNLYEVESFVLCLPNLHSLEISSPYHQTNPEEDTMLLEDLTNATQLRSLTIGRDLRPLELEYLSATVLPSLLSLTHLTVTGNLTCEEGADLINEPRHQVDDNFDDDGNLIPIAYSELGERNINAQGASSLMLAVADHPCLRHLNLGCSTDIGFLGLSMIGNLLHLVRLTELNLGWLQDMFEQGRCYDDDQKVQIARTAAHQSVVAGVQSNHHLHKLSLSGLNFPATALEEINFKLAKNKFEPFISDNDLAFGVWSHVLAKCQENIGLMFYLLREQPILLIRTADP